MYENHEQESENKAFSSQDNGNETGQDLASCQQELASCQAAQQEWKEKYMRVMADMANYNKRIEKERALWSQLARADLLTPLLDVVDNFDRAAQTEELNPGIKMIHSAFVEFLKNSGVQEVPYDTFNPDFHDALMQVDPVEGKDSGTIVQVMQKGYALGDKVLRPAKVSVTR